jgi:hypothetical protein
MMSDEVEVTLVTSQKTGALEVEPTFTKDMACFHPLPKSLQSKYKEGDVVKGSFGIIRPTGHNDVREKPIYISYFIPTVDRHV